MFPTRKITSSVAAGFGRYGKLPTDCNADLWPFDLETGMQVASKVGKLPSKYGHATLLGSRIIRYVREGRTDRGTDGLTDGQKQRLLFLPYGRGHKKRKQEVKVIWQKAPHGGPISRLGVTPGGRTLYHWIPGIGFPILVFHSNYRPRMHRLATVHARDDQRRHDTAYLNKRLFY